LYIISSSTGAIKWLEAIARENPFKFHLGLGCSYLNLPTSQRILEQLTSPNDHINKRWGNNNTSNKIIKIIEFKSTHNNIISFKKNLGL
jgi:hypothetical protein